MTALRRLYIDTNVFARAFEASADLGGHVRDMLTRLRGQPGFAVTSELTLAELTAPINRPDAMPFEERKRLYFNLLVRSRFIDLQPVSRAVLIETSEFRRQALSKGRKPKLPDSIHVVTAMRSGCSYLMSNDAGMGPLPNSISAISSQTADVAAIMRELHA